MADPIETALLKEAVDGDIDAFEMLHQLLEPAITRFVRRLIGPVPEVEDVVQDTFLSLYLNMHKIDPLDHLRPYTFRIARNRAYDLLRSNGRYDEVSLDNEPVTVRVSFDLSQGAENQPEDATHWLLLHLEVQEAMEHLPQNQRDTLILYSEEQLTYAEIAEVMDISIGTVKSRLFHAKKTLRRLLRPETLQAIMGESDSPDESDDEASEPEAAPTPATTGEQVTSEPTAKRSTRQTRSRTRSKTVALPANV